MKRLIALALCACFALPLTGCTNALDLYLMVVSMGVDVAGDGVTVTIKVPSYAASAQSGGEEGGEGSASQTYLTISASGADWAQAMTALSAATPRSLHFSQLREVVVGMDSLQHARLPDLLACIDRLQSARTQAMLVMCPGKAQEFITRQQPFIGKRLSKHIDAALKTYESIGVIPSSPLANVLRDYMGYWRFAAPLQVGDYVIFEDMLHYTTVKTTMFNGISHPSLAFLRENGVLEVLKRYQYEDYRNRMD